MFHRTSLLPALSLLLAACAGVPERLHRAAVEQGFAPLTLKGEGFLLTSYYKPPAAREEGLHVYLEGDGTPWVTPHRIADDPTPRNPLMLRLMARDPAAALYLGRPCYNGRADDAGCSPSLWTHRRYAPEVVSSMAAALNGFLLTYQQSRCGSRDPLSPEAARLVRRPAPASSPPADNRVCGQMSSLLFLGHSGGGVLALQLARRFPQTRLVVTMATPLDIDAWSDHHGYSRLQGSVNPADTPNAGFPEIHYFGEKDERVPPGLFRQALAKRPKARMVIVEKFTHACCWERIWPEVLSGIRAAVRGL